MDKLADKFKNHKANIGYVVAGYPSLDYTKELLQMLDKSCLDVLELGLPYSDPLADGKVIAKASFSASRAGITASDVFSMLDSLSAKPKAALVFLVYYNIIYAYGVDKFIASCVNSGISGIIVPDLPFEEAGELKEACEVAGLALVPLVSVTSLGREELVAPYTKGFIYLVGAIGVSGSARASKERLEDMRKRLAKISDLPVAVGFGVKDAAAVSEVHSYADGAIIGTAIVEGSSSHDPAQLIAYINELFGKA